MQPRRGRRIGSIRRREREPIVKRVNDARCASRQDEMAVMIFYRRLHEQNYASILLDDDYPSNWQSRGAFPAFAALDENFIAIFQKR